MQIYHLMMRKHNRIHEHLHIPNLLFKKSHHPRVIEQEIKRQIAQVIQEIFKRLQAVRVYSKVDHGLKDIRGHCGYGDQVRRLDQRLIYWLWIKFVFLEGHKSKRFKRSQEFQMCWLILWLWIKVCVQEEYWRSIWSPHEAWSADKLNETFNGTFLKMI